MNERISVDTRGNSDIVDLTPKVAALVSERGLRHGQVLIFVVGSTASLTTTEFEPGLRKDIPAVFDKLVPSNDRYHHDETWHDGNGHSHVRASIVGPSLTVPYSDGRLLLGTWQQIVLLDFDNRPRTREIVVQLIGEK